MIYQVYTAGYYNCPEFYTLKKAHEYLRELVEEEWNACKKRFPDAKKTKISEFSYKIEFGCNLWSAHCILKI